MACTGAAVKINQAFKRTKDFSCLEGGGHTSNIRGEKQNKQICIHQKCVETLLIVPSQKTLPRVLPFSCNGFSKKITLNTGQLAGKVTVMFP